MQQINHPNRNKRSYWYLSPRGFANEYTVGIASNLGARAYYRDAGWEHINASRAIRELSNRGDEATKVFCSVCIDGAPDDRDRFELARSIAKGETL